MLSRLIFNISAEVNAPFAACTCKVVATAFAFALPEVATTTIANVSA
ncbi:MAG: hypothetical protein Q9M43_00215 [Sulfurimonas sp.]|nr:hypothetical protein [Sulfurimonas sp.]